MLNGRISDEDIDINGKGLGRQSIYRYETYCSRVLTDLWQRLWYITVYMVNRSIMTSISAIIDRCDAPLYMSVAINGFNFATILLPIILNGQIQWARSTIWCEAREHIYYRLPSNHRRPTVGKYCDHYKHKACELMLVLLMHLFYFPLFQEDNETLESSLANIEIDKSVSWAKTLPLLHNLWFPDTRFGNSRWNFRSLPQISSLGSLL